MARRTADELTRTLNAVLKANPQMFLDMAAERTCRVCGCYNMAPCETGSGPCGWVGDDLCSACIGRPAAIRDALDMLAARVTAVGELQWMVAYAHLNREDSIRADELADELVEKLDDAIGELFPLAMAAQRLLDETRWPTALDDWPEPEPRKKGPRR